MCAIDCIATFEGKFHLPSKPAKVYSSSKPTTVSDKRLPILCEYFCKLHKKGGRMGIKDPALWGLGEIDGLLVPPGKSSNLLTDHLITGKPLMAEPAQEK